MKHFPKTFDKIDAQRKKLSVHLFLKWGREMKMTVRKKRTRVLCVAVSAIVAVVTAAALVLGSCGGSKIDKTRAEYKAAEREVRAYARENGIDFNKYPDELIDLLARNPETEDYVLSYPKYKNKSVSNPNNNGGGEVPLYMQWDKRWGYKKYSGQVAGLTGCGPTCLSMAAVYLTQNLEFSPAYMMDMAQKNGYTRRGNGSSWKLISEGAEKIGLVSTELPLDKTRIISALKKCHPVIIVVGPGDFTSTGHFLIIREYKNGKFLINDPNSYENSNKEWDYERIKGQIRNLWEIS